MEGELAECRAAVEEADAHVTQLQALRTIEAAARRAASAEHQARRLARFHYDVAHMHA